MIAYIRYKNIFAVFAEISLQLGLKPFFKFKRIGCEIIIHMPYGFIILTPRSALVAERAEMNEPVEHGQKSHRHSQYSARAAEN